MITRSLIERIFSAASIERWNDHPRPMQFSELAKQAHKMVIAYVVARWEEDEGRTVDWAGLIEGGLFELLHRVILTDIKPPVFHRMMDEQGEQVNHWVFEQLHSNLDVLPGGLWDRFQAYFQESGYMEKEKKILKGAHYMATQWEFDLIYNWGRTLTGIERTRLEIEAQIEEHRDLPAIARMLDLRERQERARGISGFVDLVGQLRFQKRWAQTPRIPQTSVLGHLLFVALLSYLVSAEAGLDGSRQINNYLCGLFHDLPEVMTRDIISPVKKSVEGLDSMVKKYERQAMEERIFPLVPEGWVEQLRYFTEDEFENKTRLRGGAVRKGLTFEEMSGYAERKESDPLDGNIVGACDKLAAYIEAAFSIRFGIRSPALMEGLRRGEANEQYRKLQVGGFHFGVLFDYFQV